ncbi:hypothetical protein [Ottowia thiooxydans]|uniref:hypothetical protein n=1 Tax=Ottowia thiooxydans TaxID=219182 RepID=UPI00146E2BB0|nr:hypothetical protein [Ottowia thiooxydans]
MSDGNAWLKPFNVIDTRSTTPVTPDTVIGDGYNDAACPGEAQGLGQSVMVIAVEFVNVTGAAWATCISAHKDSPTTLTIIAMWRPQRPPCVANFCTCPIPSP